MTLTVDANIKSYLSICPALDSVSQYGASCLEGLAHRLRDACEIVGPRELIQGQDLQQAVYDLRLELERLEESLGLTPEQMVVFDHIANGTNAQVLGVLLEPRGPLPVIQGLAVILAEDVQHALAPKMMRAFGAGVLRPQRGSI